MLLCLTLSRSQCLRMLASLLNTPESGNRTATTFRIGNIIVQCAPDHAESDSPLSLPMADGMGVSLRLAKPPEPKQKTIIRIGPLMIDATRVEIRYRERAVTMRPAEFRLLYLLASQPGRVFSRRQIIQTLHGNLASVTDRSVDVMIMAVRRKLGQASFMVETVRGAGYRMIDRNHVKSHQ